jgi:PAS domain S-box-containing protein
MIAHKPQSESRQVNLSIEPSFRQVLDAAQVPIYTTDPQGRITSYNQSAVDFWGRQPEPTERWCGSLRLFRPDGEPMPHDQCPLAETIRMHRPVSGAAVVERPDGSRRAFMAYPAPLVDEQGELVGAVNILMDITAHVDDEQRILASAEALRQSNAVKDEFLGLVSHELRTPVTTIYGNAELLRSRDEKLPAADRAAMILDIADDSERLLAVIENLLLLTRLDGNRPLEVEPQVLVHVVRTAVDSFGKRHGRDVTFTSVPLHHLVVDADRTSLDMLLGNLLSNADKYSPPGSKIEVVLAVVDGEARVTVLDRGIGLPDDADAGDLFSPFFRAQGARQMAGGMGIGLAVCKRLAENQGGRVWAVPRPGGGAEVGFGLPLAPEPEA